MSWIIGAKRSAVVPRGGGFAGLSIEDLGAPVLLAALASAGLGVGAVDEVIVSNALGAGGNPARRVALAAGLPERVAGLSIDRQCAGGLDAVLLARALVESGAAKVVIAGGVESYSRRPLRFRTDPAGQPVPYDQAPFTPWPDRDPDMAVAAEALAQAMGISRRVQDQWAVDSHAKARRADLSDEIVSIAGRGRDAFTRALTGSVAARAKAVVGSITAANAAVASDAAAFVVVSALPVGRAVKIVAGATLGADPMQPGLSPLPAIAAVGGAKNLTVAEVMEAYAVQAIACIEGAAIDPGIVNLGGGALARGHPIGASGAILAVRLYHQLRQGRGLAAIAAAGGVGSALLLEV
ncbi:MAG: thiolase family protein [Paracoccaceae bacterium]